MMRLKKLSCHGFKSFADRTEFEFDAPLTGIIGPNGCGKSNVVDALKWCLGDQRARSLRGKEMTDVIFKGAEGRDGMSRAEVSIQLEACDGDGEDRTEITVGRRLTRDKESEYLLNGDSVRLKDVRDALMNTGLGVGAYSVMEQGRIDAVLSANPEDRRAIFEEAAGISRFKLHKRETLRKLDRTEQNLARVEDLVEERGRRIRSLKVQAQKARRFRKIRDSLRDLKAAVAVIETSEARKEQTDCQQKLAEKTARQKQGEEELARLTAKLGELEDTLREEGTVAEALSSRIHEASGGCDSANARAQAQQERAKDLLADAGDGEDSRQRIIEQKSEKSRSIADARRRMVAMEEELTELGGALVGREDAVRDSVAEIKGLRARCEQLREQALGWIHRKTRLRNAAHDQEAQLRSLDARRARLDQRLAEIEGETTAMEAEQQAVDRALTGVREQMAALAVEESKAMALLENADQQAADLTRREAELREQLSSVVGQLEVLLDMESHLEGLDQGPRHIIEQAPSGVTGRLLDLIETDMEHGRALEVALGPFVQALVVDTHVRASELLAHLSAGQHGRALLLVEDAFSAKVTARSSVEIPATAELLADHVRCSSKIRPIVDWLLRGVCLVESLDDVRTGSSDLCFVTREGGLTCGPRTEGGRGEGQAGLFIRKLQIQDLKDREASLRGQLKDLLAGRVEADDRVAELKSEASRLVEAMSELRVQEQQAQGKEDVASQRFLDLKSERQLHQLEVEEIRGLRITCIADLGTCLLNAFLADRFEKQVSANERSVASDLVTAEGVLQSARQAEQEVRLRQVSCARDREGLSAAIRVYEQSMSDLEQLAGDLEDRLLEAKEGAQAASAEAARYSEEAAAHSASMQSLQKERAQQQERHAGAVTMRDRCRSELGDLETQRGGASEEITELRLALSELQHGFSRLEERLREDTGIELRRCLGEVEGMGLVVRRPLGPPTPEGVDVIEGPAVPRIMLEGDLALTRLWLQADFDSAAARKESQVLGAKLDRLGNVNLDAVTELEEMESSYEFLVQQVKDLNESRQHLMETLRRMETESRALFEETFVAARENFAVIFRKLFQGGRADMFLAEGEDSLESGIEIVARPPGKELQSINLLSGGERSLTALAILFAVFKVKPSPFCILDEVDAALDEANVERFLRVLQEFVGPTQFCIVTHHKRTMAACQSLYGVTMQKRGVSSKLAVSLEQVDNFTNGNGSQGSDEALTNQRIAGEEQVGF